MDSSARNGRNRRVAIVKDRRSVWLALVAAAWALALPGCTVSKEAPPAVAAPPAPSRLPIPASGPVAVSLTPSINRPVSPDLLALGKRVYEKQCAACHGADGRGEGEAADLLYPKPRALVARKYATVP